MFPLSADNEFADSATDVNSTSADVIDEESYNPGLSDISGEDDQHPHSSPISCLPGHISSQSTVTFSVGKDSSWTRFSDRKLSGTVEGHSIDGRLSLLSRKLGHSRNVSSSSSFHIATPTDTYVNYSCGLFAQGSVPGSEGFCHKCSSTHGFIDDSGDLSDDTSEPINDQNRNECSRTPFDCYIDLFRCVDSE